MKVINLLIVLFATFLAGSAMARDREQTRKVMGEVAAELELILPFLFKPGDFENPDYRPRLLRHLKTLQKNSVAFEEHGAKQNFWFAYMTRSVANDMRDVVERFEAGDFDEARFVLRNMTSHCRSCHSKFNESYKYSGFAAVQQSMKSLPTLEKAHFLVVTRRFGQALDLYEKYITVLTNTFPQNLDNATVAQYLKVALRVKKDAKRPALFLRRLNTKNINADSKELLQNWLVTLDFVNSRIKENNLATGRLLYKKGLAIMHSPLDWSGLAYFAAASGVLHNYIDNTIDNNLSSEAFFYLGKTEELLGFEFWSSQSEIYYEAAIRTDPGSEFASKAYYRLEELVIHGYTGSSGTNIPRHVKAALRNLQKLNATPNKT